MGSEVVSHDGGVNNVSGRKSAATRDDGFTNLNWALRHSLAFNFSAASSLQCAGHNGSQPQVIVSRMDNRIHLCLADVSALGFERSFSDRDDHFISVGPTVQIASVNTFDAFLLLAGPPAYFDYSSEKSATIRHTHVLSKSGFPVSCAQFKSTCP